MKSKQEVIQQHYEQAGLVWDEISSMVNMNDGTITLKDPKLKHTLTGYENAVFKKMLQVITLTDTGLWLELVSLGNLDYNNGWITIKKKSELPEGNCWVRVYCESNIPDKPIDYISEKYKVNPVMLECVVQYQPIIKPEAPIY